MCIRDRVDTPTLKQEGQEQADRDDSKQALKMDADSIGITFIITNTSKTDPATGDGAWFKASDLDLADSTIVGDAHVDMDSLTYPDNWDTLVLKPGESVSVTAVSYTHLAVQFWQYKDDASGAWGPATSLDSVRAAMNNAGVTLEGDGVTKAQAALDQARTECETGFQRRHPGEGNGDCRVVAVGAVPAVIGGNYIYNGSGAASPTGTGGW